MMEKCFDTGTIQAFLDGELAPELREKVACHVADCEPCMLALAEAEEETAVVFSALEQQFNTLVPTERLWTKINDSIEQKKGKSLWQTAFANFKVLFANPSIAAFAGLLIVAVMFAVIWNPKSSETGNNIARNNEKPKQKVDISNKSVEPTILPVEKLSGNPEIISTKNPSPVRKANNYQVVKADFVKPDIAKEQIRQPVSRIKPTDFAPPRRPAAAQYLPGEETYIKTIATLEKTVDGYKDQVLKPSARFSFEKDLAVANDAIDKMKTEVKQNPKNEAAKQVLRASYQNKIDLLNSVAEKNDLMASIR